MHYNTYFCFHQINFFFSESNYIYSCLLFYCYARAHANFARSQVGPVRRVFHSPWEELVADHGIVLGDCIIFHFPKEDNHTFVIQITNRKRKNKTRIDTSGHFCFRIWNGLFFLWTDHLIISNPHFVPCVVSAEAFNHDIEYKLECAILSNGVSLCDEARANLHSMLSTVVLGQELFLCIVYLQPTSSSAWYVCYMFYCLYLFSPLFLYQLFWVLVKCSTD